MMDLLERNEVLYSKANWKTVRLVDVCDIDPSKKELNGIDKKTEVSFGMMADLGEHTRRFEPKQLKKISDLAKAGYSYFKENDVLLAKMTPCFENGKSGIALNLSNGIGFGSTEFFVLRANEQITPDWIYYVVSSDKFLNQGKYSMVGTTGRRRLMKQFVENFQIPLPDTSEQKRITSILRSIEKSQDDIENQIGRLKKLLFALSNSLTEPNPYFGNLISNANCTKTTFSNVADCIESHTKDKSSFSNFIGLEDIEPDNFKLINRHSISEGTTFTKTFLKGDVLFGKRRSYLRKVAIADFDGICSGDILVFRAKEETLLPALLPFYVFSEAFINHAINTSAGSLSPRTKWKDLANLQLTIPDLYTQLKILEVLMQVQVTIEQLQEQSKTIKTLKSKLINEILD